MNREDPYKTARTSPFVNVQLVLATVFSSPVLLFLSVPRKSVIRCYGLSFVFVYIYIY